MDMKKRGGKMKKLLIFDLDGTIADTIDSIKHAVNLAGEQMGYPARTYEEVRLAIGSGARRLMMSLMPPEDAQDEAKVDKFLDIYNGMYEKTYMEADRCYDGMHETLRELKGRGYTLAILSNKQDEYVKLIAEQIIERGIVSRACGQLDPYPTKPDPTVPRMIAESLGFECADCAFIGDSEVDVLTAKNAEMLSVACSWGYRSADILLDHGADIIIDSPDALLEIFR
jgi:phosphoglycolate phosphatase